MPSYLDDYYQKGLETMQRDRPDEFRAYVLGGQATREGEAIKDNFWHVCVDIGLRLKAKEGSHATA